MASPVEQSNDWEKTWRRTPEELIAEAKRTEATELDLSGLELRAVPETVWELTALQKLDLWGNQLTALPERVGELTALQRIDLSDNRLTTLPAALGKLTALQGLFLQGNPGLGLPDEILGPMWGETIGANAKPPKPPAEILGYYFSTRGEEGSALREMKLIVVGWGKAGKTTLVRRLADQPMNPREPETYGIMIRSLTLHCTDGDLLARIWDFGGQSVLHAVHEFFLTARSLYLVVLEQRSDRAEMDAEYWLQLIRSYAPDAPIVVALNKSRGVEHALDRDSLEKSYGPIIAWVATECLPEVDCPGAEATITRLREALTAAAEERWMPEPRERFPRKWLAIKGWLEGLEKGKNYLDYEAFAQACAERGEPDPQKQREVAAMMHDLGIAMSYARDERLRDTTVLRLDWLANGIYAVLGANLFLPNKPLAPDAVLTADKLGEIYSVAAQEPVKMLRAEDYPAEKWEFLLRLMNLFQLTFPITEDGTEQLCPALLRVDPPPGTDEPTGDDTVRLRFEFAVVPPPLLPRFMVRTFSLIERNRLWQRGAVLRYLGAHARVWKTAEDKYLFVTAAGPAGDRAELLTLIRGTLKDLFAEFKELRVTEQRWFDGLWVPRGTLEKFGVLKPEWDGDVSETEVTKL